MIAQLQNLQAFVANHLADVVDWSRDVRPDPNRKTSGESVLAEKKKKKNCSAASAAPRLTERSSSTVKGCAHPA